MVYRSIVHSLEIEFVVLFADKRYKRNRLKNMWADNETQTDLLGFQVHADLIQSIVTDSRLLPITVGVFGDWGSGKSSIIKMLQNSLESENNIACIYFNGWQFEGYDEAKSALIHSILLELGEHKKLDAKIKEKAANLLQRINWLRLFSVGYQTVVAPIITAQIASMTGTFPMAAPVSPPASSDKSPDLADVDLTELLRGNPASQGIVGAREFRSDFKELIAETKLDSLVILIDDLDRCEPSRLVETLEAIKLFLSVANVAFVIGADQRIVRYAIAKRYETGRIEEAESRAAGQLDLVTDYLEKLIQIPYHLPRLSASEIETYISLLFCQLRLGDDFKHVHDAFLASRKEDITQVFRHQEITGALQHHDVKLLDVLASELAWCSSISLTLSDLLKGNPRQTKRLLNALLLRKKLAEAARIELSDQILVKLMILEYLQPELFSQLYQWQSAQEGKPQELEALERGTQSADGQLKDMADKILKSQPGWQTTAVQTWLQMVPSLVNEDLRNYFWITRDRITGILSGVAAIPLHLRNLLADLLDSGDSTILGETEAQIKTLLSDEKLVLFNELTAYARREPGSQNAIGVWIRVAQMLPEYIPKLITVLAEIAPASLNRTTPIWLVRIAQNVPGHKTSVAQLLDKWARESNTLGIAAKDALDDLKRER